MPEIAVQRASNKMYPVIEDANLSKNRIFIEGQGYDANTLSPLWMQHYHFNHTDVYTYTSDSFVDYAPMILSKGVEQCWGNADGQYFHTGLADTYWRSLDYDNFPVKKGWKTAGGRSYYTLLGRTSSASSDNYNDIHMVGDDAVSGTTYRSTNGERRPSQFIFEDSSNDRMWGFFSNRSDYDRLVTWTAYESGIATNFATPLELSAHRMFFMGTDDSNFLYVLSVEHGGYSRYNIYKFNSSNAASTTVMTNSYRGYNTNYLRCYPSNIRRDSSTRRVFYSSHYEATYDSLAPIRYVWDPSDGSITATNCTMTYSGSDTYSTHAARHTVEGADGYQRNSWSMRPWQFSLGGTNYISFWIIDRSAAYGNGPNRWSSEAKRTMLTFTVGSGTGDDVLTYHSKLTFSSTNDVPRGLLPLNAAGTHMAVPITNALRFYTFNANDGWALSGTYPTEFRMIGLDQSNRLWGASTEKGYHTVHMISPSLPITISVATANSNYTYTGNNISTTATVNAYNSEGSRVVANVSLTIDGNGMIFTSSNSKNLTVTTSNSADTTVALTISNGGLNNIIASIDI